MTAYYNEIDPYAAEWLRSLIKAGHIADGVVDTRSISDIEPHDLLGFTQCHFFAGVGVWSHALRSAGWPDDRPVWTGSCPCQPFSSAGKGAGFADERHLWPHWLHLIRIHRPPVIFGEQVASKDGLGWLDLVQADLEAEDHAFGAFDLCAAGVGAPHIRQRLYWVADAQRDGCRSQAEPTDHRQPQADGPADRAGGRGRALSELADPAGEPPRRVAEGVPAGRPEPGGHSSPGGMADAVRAGGGRASRSAECGGGAEPIRLGPQVPGRCSGAGRLGHPVLTRLPDPELDRLGGSRWRQEGGAAEQPGRSFWSDADWLFCRDRKFRPVEPGHVTLAYGLASVLGRLRAGSSSSREEVDAEVLSRIGEGVEGSLREVRQAEGDASAACASPGREPGEQRPAEPDDVVRLLSPSRSLAELHGDWRTARALHALHRAICEAGAVQHPSEPVEAVWARLGEEAQGRIRMAIAAARWVVVEPFPLVASARSRMGRLRAYGNAIAAPLAQTFIEAYLDLER